MTMVGIMLAGAAKVPAPAYVTWTPWMSDHVAQMVPA